MRWFLVVFHHEENTLLHWEGEVLFIGIWSEIVQEKHTWQWRCPPL